MANPTADPAAVDVRAAAKRVGAGEPLKLSNYLGILRDDPEDRAAYQGLSELVEARDPARLGAEPVRLLEAARQVHEARGEFVAVAKLLEVEARLLEDDPAFASSLWKELGRLQADELLNAEAAAEAYSRAQRLSPDDTEIADALTALEQAHTSWRKFAKRFIDEADSATDLALRVSLLLRAASLVFRYNKKKGRDEETDELLQRALQADPGNRRAVHLYEHTLRLRERWQPLADMLLEAADRTANKIDQLNFNARAARLFVQHLHDPERACACYERVLDNDHANSEAMGFLSEYFAKAERWDDLAAMYEQALKVRHKLDVEQGILLQIGMVHWRMRDKPQDAEPYFARLRKHNPAHVAVIEFYCQHYAGPEHIEALLGILTDAQRVAPDDATKLEFALATAKAARGLPEQKDRAIEAWKLVQRLDPSNREALAALKELYLRAEKWNALADVIKAEIEAKPEGDPSAEVRRKVGLLRELLAIYRDRLHMDGMVIGTLGRIVKLTPSDNDALTELATKYETAGRYNDLINVLSERAEALTEPAEKLDAYLRVARLWIERFANHSQATGPLEKVLQIDPDNGEALGQLKDIYEKKRAWKQLFEVLLKERSVTADPAKKLANTIDMAKLAADRLQGYAQAIALWKEAIAMDPRAPGAVEALEKLAEGEKDYATLGELLETELSQAKSDETRIRILQKLALLHGERLEQPAAALSCWRRILEIEPKHGRALRAVRDALLKAHDWDGLFDLYVGVRDWEGLADVFSHEADRAESAQLKVDLSFRAARVFEDKVGDPNRAVRSYERVLSVDPQNARAAAALVPIYEKDAKWSRLRAMLELMLQATTDTERQLALLGRLRELCVANLRDGDAAFGYAAAAYRIAPESHEVGVALEATAEAALAFDRVLELYLARAAEIGSGQAIALRRRIAAIALDRLGQTGVAVDQLREVLAVRPADTEVMAILERLYRAEQRTRDLHGLLLHRFEHGDPAVRWASLKEIAQIEEQTLADPASALVHYRAMSEIDPSDRDVLIARDRLALATEAYAELAEVLDRRLEIEQEPAVRVDLGGRLGLLCAERLKQPERALSVFEGVLAQDPIHGSSVVAIERIAEQHPELATRAGRLLEQVYESSGRFDKLVKILERRLAGEKSDDEVRRLRLRLAEINSVELGDSVGAYGSLEAAFFEQPSDRELWDRIAEIAERADQQRSLAIAYATVIEAGDLSDDDRVELATRAAHIYDQVLGLPEEAEPFHKRILRADPLNDTSFLALKELFTSAERWDELQALYRKRISDSVDGENKLDLLLQLCFLFEEILDRPEQAIEAYQQVLQLAPDQAAARRTLERLYERTERWRDLAELLRGNLDQAEGQERIDLLFRLGELCETRLSDPGPAVDHYEGVLDAQPNHLRAQAALARLLSVEAQRQRIAGILGPLYEKQGAYVELARVLEIELEDGRTQQAAADLLVRLGALHEQRTRDLDSAFSAYARAVEADPRHEAAREALARIGSGRDTFRQKRAHVLQRALDKLGDSPSLQAEILLELAVLLDQYLGDHDGAERAYERLIELDGDNTDAVLVAARALEVIHLAKQDHARLAVDIRRQVDLESDPLRRGQLLVRLGELCETTLDSPAAAIEAHQKRIEIDAGDLDALGALERLYQRTERWAELCQTLTAHADVATDEAERRALLRRAAALRDERLADVEGAIAAYDDLLSSLGPDRVTVQALAALYERTEKHPQLLETLEREESLIDDPEDRARVQFRMAELMRLHTGDLERALECYDAVLSFNASHAGSLAALDSVMNDPESNLRGEAARLAVPRYEASASYERLLAALEVLEETGDVADRLVALRRAAEVADSGLGNASRAFDLMARAARAAASDPSLRDLLPELDRHMQAAARHADYVTLLREISPEVYDGELKPEIERRIARTARGALQDASLSLVHYAKLLEEVPEDSEALDALVDLNEKTGNHRALVAALKRKAEFAREPAARHALSMRQAEIYEFNLDEPAQAILVLQDVLADAPSATAFAALERLYTAAQRFSDLRELYERELGRQTGPTGPTVDLRYKLALIFHRNLGDTSAALEHLRDALTDDPTHEPSIALLETIMVGDGDDRAIAAAILEPIFLARAQWPKLTSALDARIAGEQDVEERKRLLTRLAQLYEDQLEDFDNAIDVYARLFNEDTSDESTWETLARLAKLGSQWSRLGKILGRPIDEAGVQDEATARLAKYAARVYVERLGNQHRAAQLYEKALAFDSSDIDAFGALETAYKHTASSDKLLQLYRDQADGAESDERRVRLLHERARLFRDALAQPAEAIATYREILEVSPNDSEATSGLEGLLALAHDWAGLAARLRERIDQSAGRGDEVALKLHLAELLEEKLGEASSAIDVYEDVANIDPKEARAVWALERLVQQPAHTLRVSRILEPIYRQLDQWKKLIAVLEAQAELIDDDAARVAVLCEIGGLHEQRGRDTALAFLAFERAFVCDPGNEQVRAQVDRLAAQRDAWNEHVAAYEAALAKTDDVTVKTTLLTTLARVHDEKRGDPRSAIAVYERLSAHDKEDPSPLDALESLHTMVGDWLGLTRVFSRKVELAFDVQERGELLRRLGSVQEELLSDTGAAILTYTRAVTEDDTDELALEALDRLYLAENNSQELANVLARRVELARDAATRVELGLRLGQVLNQQLHQPDQAIGAFQRVLDEDASVLPALTALAVLFERQGMWRELLDNLAQQQALATTSAERVQLLQRSGEILEKRQGELEEALSRYAEALEIDPSHGPSIDALIRITRSAEHRTRAVELVEPLLRAQGRFDDLVQLIEAGLAGSEDGFARRAVLQRVAELHEHSRGKPADAFDALCRALAEDASDETLVADVERLARNLGRYDLLAEVLSTQAATVPDSVVAAALYFRLGRIFEEELHDDARAIDAFAQACEREEADETLVALHRLYERTQRWSDLVDVLERRIAASTDPTTRIDFLIRLGGLRDERLADGRGAYVAFKEVLDGDPAEARALAGMERVGRYDALATDVLDTLDECYRQIGAVDKLAGLYDIRLRLAETDVERIRLLNEAARIWEIELGNAARALANVRRVFELDPSRTETLDELERLGEAAGTFDGLRGMVEGLIESGAIAGQHKVELSLRAAQWYRDRLGDPEAEERCLRWALEVDSSRMTLHERLIALLRVPGKEKALLAALREAADAERDVGRRNALLREAAEFSADALNDTETAALCYEALLGTDPQDPSALSELAMIRTVQSRHADVVALLERRLAVESDPETLTALRLRIAEIQDQDLNEAGQAILGYRRVLSGAPLHTQAVQALERLYERGAKWTELRALLESQLSAAADAGARADLRMRLAKLSEEHLGDLERAVAELLAITGESPDHQRAQDELERLYAALKRFNDLAELLGRRALWAEKAGDAHGELGSLRRMAAVYEEMLKDSPKAIEIHQRVHARDQADTRALSSLVRLLSAAQRWQEAAVAMRTLLGLLTGEDALQVALALADVADQRLGDFALAEAALLDAESKNPGRAEARERLKTLYEAHKSYEKLVRILSEEEQLVSDTAPKVALLNRIAALYRGELSDPGSAVAYLERAVSLMPDDREALLQLCDLYIAASRSRDAIPVLEKIVASYGGRRAKEVAVYQHRLGQAYEGLGETDEALARYDAAFKIDLTSVAILRDLGRLCLAKGDLDRAQKTYRALLLQKLAPDSGIHKADVYYYLGDISNKQGDKVKAKSMLERAIAEAGDHPLAKALLATL